MTSLNKSPALGMSKNTPALPTTRLSRLAMSPLAKGVTGEGFSVDLSPAYEGLTELEKELVEDRIEDDVNRIRELFRHSDISIPPDIKANYLYDAFLLRGITPINAPEIHHSDPTITDRNILALDPLHSDQTYVTQRIQEIAEWIINHLPESEEKPLHEDISSAQTAIRNAVRLTIQKNLENFDEHELIRASLTDPTKRVSTRQVRHTVRDLRAAINAEEISRKDANTELLIMLGVIDQEEALGDLDKINRQLTRAKRNALKAYEAMGQELSMGQKNAKIKGDQVHIHVGLDLECMSLFDMLDYVINDFEGQPNLKKANIAQTLAYLTYYFFLVQQNPLFEKIRDMIDPLKFEFGQKMFEGQEPSESEALHLNKAGNVTRNEGESKIGDFEIIHMPLNGHEPQRVWFDKINYKSARSWVMKIMDDPTLDIEEISDMVRGRAVMWDITEEDIDSEDEEHREHSRAILRETAIKAGESAGLNFRTKNKEDLIPGEFCVDEQKLDDNSEKPKSFKFRVVKVYGKIESKTKEEKEEEERLGIVKPDPGINFEFQVMPRSTFESKESRQSPNNDRNYNLKKVLRLVKMCFIESVFPLVHQTVDRLEQWIKNSESKMTRLFADQMGVDLPSKKKKKRRTSPKNRAKKRRGRGQKRSRA
jgi:hypothetical protein